MLSIRSLVPGLLVTIALALQGCSSSSSDGSSGKAQIRLLNASIGYD